MTNQLDVGMVLNPQHVPHKERNIKTDRGWTSLGLHLCDIATLLSRGRRKARPETGREEEYRADIAHERLFFQPWWSPPFVGRGRKRPTIGK